MGGEHYSHTGGGANNLCLPNNPKYDKYKNGYRNTGFVYGIEYEVNHIFTKTIAEHDALCVV